MVYLEILGQILWRIMIFVSWPCYTARMSAIDLYRVLRLVPNVTDEQAKQAAAGAEQTERLYKIKQDIAELKISVRTGVALLLAVLAIELAPLLQ